jgi:uncharacterized membrane protein (UPF0182 family)
MRAKLVAESLDQLFEEKGKNMANVGKTKEKFEKTDVKKPAEDKKSKAEQAIDALNKQLENAKKPGAFRTSAEKNAKIKEIEDKIANWKKKLS